MKRNMRLNVLLSGLVLLVVCTSVPLRAQQPSAFTLSPATRHGLPSLPGRVAPGSDGAPVTTPHWTSNFRSTHDTGLEGQSAVYNQPTNTMIVFGGLSIAGFDDTNAVLLYAPATGDGLWSTLIPNGTAGSPVARDSHTAVYDPATNVMTVFGGFASNLQGLSDVWVLSHANGLGGTPTWTQLSPSGGPPSGVVGSTAVYDPTNNIMTVFAGVN